MSSLLQSVVEFASDTGFAYVTPSMVIMWVVSFVLMYLAIVKKYEPLLLLPISLGALAVNIPSAGFYDGGWSIEGMFTPTAGLYYYTITHITPPSSNSFLRVIFILICNACSSN